MNLFGLEFPNPVGLAAGFDKDAVLNSKWYYMGFGFVELGTVTPKPQEGNPKKRLFRLPQDKAVINRMGFNNQGVQVMAERLKQMKKRNIIIGGNIGKNKVTPNEVAVEDYLQCFRDLYPYVDYFVVNVSSPNTPGLRELQEKEPLQNLLMQVQSLNKQMEQPRPLLLKIAPDLTEGQVDDILEIVHEVKLDGLVVSNTTIDRGGLQTTASKVEAIGAGGLSGRPLFEKSTDLLKYIRQKEAQLPLIGVGGIMSPADAKAKMAAGASLVQVYTGYVYAGPGLVRRIVRALKK